MTTDLQRMNQDEWLSALRSGEYHQHFGALFPFDATNSFVVGFEACAIGVGYHRLGVDLTIPHPYFGDVIGVNDDFLERVADLNDVEKRSCSDIADWIKGQRDAWDGDLDAWDGEQ